MINCSILHKPDILFRISFCDLCEIDLYRNIWRRKSLSTVTWQHATSWYVITTWWRSLTLVWHETSMRTACITKLLEASCPSSGCHWKPSLIKFIPHKVMCTSYIFYMGSTEREREGAKTLGQQYFITGEVWKLGWYNVSSNILVNIWHRK